jgi:hypothetical protein
LSSLFDSWLGSSGSGATGASGSETPKRMSVSEPVLVETSGMNGQERSDGEASEEEAEFERMVVSSVLRSF